jgi:hypothetical protein
MFSTTNSSSARKHRWESPCLPFYTTFSYLILMFSIHCFTHSSIWTDGYLALRHNEDPLLLPHNQQQQQLEHRWEFTCLLLFYTTFSWLIPSTPLMGTQPTDTMRICCYHCHILHNQQQQCLQAQVRIPPFPFLHYVFIDYFYFSIQTWPTDTIWICCWHCPIPHNKQKQHLRAQVRIPPAFLLYSTFPDRPFVSFSIQLLCTHPHRCVLVSPQTQVEVTDKNSVSSTRNSSINCKHRWQFHPFSFLHYISAGDFFFSN